MEPEKTIRAVVDACADCDSCRYIMDTVCLMFPRLYRLYDREQREGGAPITPEELRALVDCCNFCALCPCPNIRADIMAAKTGYIEQEGLPLSIRLMADVARVGRIGGACPTLTNRLFRGERTGRFLKRMAGIHPARRIPEFPAEAFDPWARRRRLDRKPEGGARKVVYFAGCTGRYLFPEVPRAAVRVLEKNGVDVFFPEQGCCGMPSLLEGDRPRTLAFAEANIRRLADLVDEGYDILCSCPTCGYLFKTVLREGAYYSGAYQEAVGPEPGVIKVPADGRKTGSAEGDFIRLKTSMYGRILKDEGYFSSIDPMARIAVAENIYDLGEYLLRMAEEGDLDTGFSPVPGRMAYYPPCHLREQEIGRPWLDLLGRVEGISVTLIKSSFYCCGIAGIMGFKADFHETSIGMGRPLAEKIGEIDPDRLLTDCLSCRIQFNQMIPRPVLHPVQILERAYSTCGSE